MFPELSIQIATSARPPSFPVLSSPMSSHYLSSKNPDQYHNYRFFVSIVNIEAAEEHEQDFDDDGL